MRARRKPYIVDAVRIAPEWLEDSALIPEWVYKEAFLYTINGALVFEDGCDIQMFRCGPGDWLWMEDENLRTAPDDVFWTLFEDKEHQAFTATDLDAIRDRAVNELMAYYREVDGEAEFRVNEDGLVSSERVDEDTVREWLEIIGKINGNFSVYTGRPDSVLYIKFNHAYYINEFVEKYSICAYEYRNYSKWRMV